MKGISADDLPEADYFDSAPVTSTPDRLGQAIEKVIQVWPSYKNVQRLITHELPRDVTETLASIATRLVEQHIALKAAANEIAELKLEVDELQEETEAAAQALKSRKREVTFLQKELMQTRARHGRGTGTDLNESSRLNTSDVSSAPATSPRDERLKKDGIYSPTPFLLAGTTEPALKRETSLRRVEGRHGGVSDSGEVVKEGRAFVWPSQEEQIDNASDEQKQTLLKSRIDELVRENKSLKEQLSR